MIKKVENYETNDYMAGFSEYNPQKNEGAKTAFLSLKAIWN
jgi:hypothetical protein